MFFIKYRPLLSPDTETGAGTETTTEEKVETTATEGTTEATTEETTAEPTAEGEAAPPNAIAKRIDTLTAEKWDYRRKAEAAEGRAAAAETELAEMRRKATTTTETAGTDVPTVPASQVEARARALAESTVFGEKCSRLYDNAKKDFPDFDGPLDALKRVSPSVDNTGRPALTRDFIEAVFEAEQESETGARAHDIMYALGKDTAAADRIMSMPPARQAVAIAKFASKVQPKTAPGSVRTGAPAPIVPRVGTGTTTADISPSDLDNADKLSTSEWMKAREKQLKQKASAQA